MKRDDSPPDDESLEALAARLRRIEQEQRGHEEREAKRQGERVETCIVCQRDIPHGDRYVPIVRNVTRTRLANPDFIGKQPKYTHVEQAPAGAICVTCIRAGCVPL